MLDTFSKYIKKGSEGSEIGAVTFAGTIVLAHIKRCASPVPKNTGFCVLLNYALRYLNAFRFELKEFQRDKLS